MIGRQTFRGFIAKCDSSVMPDGKERRTTCVGRKL